MDAGQPLGTVVVAVPRIASSALEPVPILKTILRFCTTSLPDIQPDFCGATPPQSSGAERGHCQESGQCAIRTVILAAASMILSTFASLSPRTCASFVLHSKLTLPTV